MNEGELKREIRKLVIKMWLMSLTALGLGATALLSILYLIKLMYG